MISIVRSSGTFNCGLTINSNKKKWNEMRCTIVTVVKCLVLLLQLHYFLLSHKHPRPPLSQPWWWWRSVTTTRLSGRNDIHRKSYRIRWIAVPQIFVSVSAADLTNTPTITTSIPAFVGGSNHRSHQYHHDNRLLLLHHRSNHLLPRRQQQQQYQKITAGRTKFTKNRTMILRRYISSPNNNNQSNENDNVEIIDQRNNKFGWKQRLASIQCLLLGAIVGSIAQAPISLVHNLVINTMNPIAQWEYDTDSSAIIGGLFAIVYRYCIREDSISNPQLSQGCVSAMILIRTLPQIHIPSYCTAIPLKCQSTSDLYLYIVNDWNVLQQFFWCGFESTILFTTTAMMMDIAMEKGLIPRFPG